MTDEKWIAGLRGGMPLHDAATTVLAPCFSACDPASYTARD